MPFVIRSLSFPLNRTRACLIGYVEHMRIMNYCFLYILCVPCIYVLIYGQFVLCMSIGMCGISFGIYHCKYICLCCEYVY